MKKEPAANEVVIDNTASNDLGAITPESKPEQPRKAWPVLRVIESMSDANTTNFAFAATPFLNVKKQGSVVTLETVSESGQVLSSVNTATSGYQTMKDFIFEHVDTYALARIRTIVKVMHNLQV